MSKTIAIIQARLTSTRFPRKVLEKINGKSMIGRVCAAARNARYVDKVVVAWAERYPHLAVDNVLGRFQEIIEREKPSLVVRITSDCPLLTGRVIDEAIRDYYACADGRCLYICNRDAGALDGFDVQVFSPLYLLNSDNTDREHVIKPYPKLSVDTPEDLERVRAFAAQLGI